MAPKVERKKVNFMVDKQLLLELERLVPAGKRSDFVNDSLDCFLSKEKKKIAGEGMRKLAKKMKLNMSMDEVRNLKDYGRK